MLKYEYALVVRIAETEPPRWQWEGPGPIAEGGLLAILNRAGKEG